MKIVNLIQGTPEWHAHRTKYFNASDAPAMMGCSHYERRSDLVKRLATGIQYDVTPQQQRIFDAGHEYEKKAIEIAINVVGQDLYPVTGISDCGLYSASFDGITMIENELWEHKTMNNVLREYFSHYLPSQEANASLLPLMYRVQMEHQLMVSGANRCLFMASKFENILCVEHDHAWYYPDLELRKQIIEGWKLLAEDVANYQHAASPETIVTTVQDALPAIFVQVRGEVTASNLAEFNRVATDSISSINTELETDDDFAQAEKDIKWLKDVEQKTEQAKDHLLSQISSIDDAFKILNRITEFSSENRLQLTKLVKTKKEDVKHQLVQVARTALNEHREAISIEIGIEFYPADIQPDFASAIKNKSLFSKMQEAINNELNRCKIELNIKRNIVVKNLELLNVNEFYSFLFQDKAQIIYKNCDDFEALVKSRIADYEEAQTTIQAQIAEQSAQKAALIELNAPIDDESKLVALRDINAMFAPLSLSAEAIKQISGVLPTKFEKSTKMYKASDVAVICNSLFWHIEVIKKSI